MDNNQHLKEMIVGAWRLRWKAFGVFFLFQVLLSMLSIYLVGYKFGLFVLVLGIGAYWSFYLFAIWFPYKELIRNELSRSEIHREPERPTP